MKLFFLSFCLLGILKADEYHLYLLAGQSNMDGRGKSADLTKEQRRPSKHAIIFYRNPPHSSEGWKPLTPGYSIAPGYKGKLPSPTFGPEIGFIAAMHKAAPDQKFALIKGSKGGSSLRQDWKPGTKDDPKSQGPRYRHFIETIDMAKAALKNDGHTAKLKGVLWHQGESDSRAGTEAHTERLTDFIARLREDTGEPQLPFIIGEVFDNGARDKIRAALLKVSQTTPHCAFAPADQLTTWDPGTHFDARSQLILGERFATALQKVTSAAK
ncbi:sialate O-acetylesterase [Verrucomicrobiaceae bacterium 227]